MGGLAMQFKLGKFNFAIWTDKNKSSRSKGGRPKTAVNYEKVIGLRNAGKSVREVAEELHISKSTVSNIMNNPDKYK